MVLRGVRPGFSFQVWEDHSGREYRYGKAFLPCDPTDTAGAVYLPKTTLVVQRSPDGKTVVVGEKRAFLVRSDAEVDARLQKEEAFVAANQAPPKGFLERLRHWWRRNVTREPYLQFVFDDGRLVISKGELASAAGPMVEVILAPFFAGADLAATAPEEGAEEPAEDAEPTPVPTPIATDSLRAPMKILRYLKPYEELVLEDLAPYIAIRSKVPRRRPYIGR